MKTYADANALVRLYLQSPDCLRVAKEMGPGPVPVTDLIRFEVQNAIERMIFESRAGSFWRISPEVASLAQGDFIEQIKEGKLLKAVPLTLADLEGEFDSLVRRFTATHGFRTYDVMHVSSALALRCKRFVSFDAKANSLAKLVGLETISLPKSGHK